ncbi:uncharacterized protein LAJ45_00688 [Morchella importuna]|uniref:uncharacterized protein n=1 Tax=Morchella importuna TaxID=1174673 RepID=UPI001E8CF4C3|nr:uncharacterized protein LAJ45_00688 [Morchella importuna]KAH8155678.1 hypothetical protein LAJ45_00688 [Morchella importuna]
MSRRYMTVIITPSPLYNYSSTIINPPPPDDTFDPTTVVGGLGEMVILPPSAYVNILDEHTEIPPLDIDVDHDGTLDYTPKLSKLITLKLPKNREALKNLNQTQKYPRDTPPETVEVPSCFRKASTSGDVVLTSKDSYIAWFLEDPDPNPPARQQRPLPSQLTAFELSGVYTIGECMKGCSGPPPGTGCPICEPVDFKNIAQVHSINIK